MAYPCRRSRTRGAEGQALTLVDRRLAVAGGWRWRPQRERVGAKPPPTPGRGGHLTGLDRPAYTGRGGLLTGSGRPAYTGRGGLLSGSDRPAYTCLHQEGSPGYGPGPEFVQEWHGDRRPAASQSGRDCARNYEGPRMPLEPEAPVWRSTHQDVDERRGVQGGLTQSDHCGVPH